MDRNIVTLASNRLLYWGSISEKSAKISKKHYTEKFVIKTKKGKWRLMERKDFIMPDFINGPSEPSDGFFGIYYSNLLTFPATIEGGGTCISADFKKGTLDDKFIDSTIQNLTKKVLEPRFFSITEVCDDYLLNAAAKLWISSIPLILSPLGYAAYQSQISTESLYIMGMGFGMLVTGGYLPIDLLLNGPVTRITSELGRLYDKKRMPMFPENFLYGLEACKALAEQDEKFETENRKIVIYNDFIKAGLKIPKQDFVDAFKGIKREKESISIQDNSREKLQNYGIPLEKAVNIFSYHLQK